jgi:chromosome condensin MukBEF MukE localization factor
VLRSATWTSPAARLLDLLEEMKERGSRLVLAELDDGVRAELDRYGVIDAIGADATFETVADAVAAFGARD